MSRSACCARCRPGRASATRISARRWRPPINEWQIAEWTSKDSRLKGSIVVANEDGPAAAAEIRKRAGDKNFVQVLLLSRNVEPLGQRRYWPIYEAAAEAGLPIGIHAFGFGGNPITASGWPSYYIEEMVGHSQCQQTALASLVLEGVFERHPEPEDGDDRGRLRLGAVAVVAARQELAAHAQRSAASSSGRRRNISATTSAGPRSRWKTRNGASICST